MSARSQGRIQHCDKAGWIIGLVLSLCAGPVAWCDEAPAVDVTAALDAAADYLVLGKPRDALDALKPIEQVEPENPWLWFYRGNARYLLRDPHEAMRAYDLALTYLADMGDPDPGLAEQIRLYRSRARRQVFNISWQTGLYYDTNVTYLGETDVDLGGLISGEDDGKFGTQFRLDYAPIVTETDMLVAGTRIGHAWHFAVNEFDLQDYGAYISYSRRIGDNLEPAIRYDYDITLLGNELFLSSHTLTPSLTWHWDPVEGPIAPRQSTIYYQLRDRDFLFDIDPVFDRDSLSHTAGAEQRFRLTPLADHYPAWQWDATFGYRLTSIPTDGDEYDRLIQDFHFGVAFPLLNPWEPDAYLLIPDLPMRFTFDVQWQLSDYRRGSIIDRNGNNRYDHITSYAWTLSQKLMEDPELGDLTLQGIVLWTDAKSNVELQDPDFSYKWSEPFTYTKTVFGLQLIWQW